MSEEVAVTSVGGCGAPESGPVGVAVVWWFGFGFGLGFGLVEGLDVGLGWLVCCPGAGH